MYDVSPVLICPTGNRLSFLSPGRKCLTTNHPPLRRLPLRLVIGHCPQAHDLMIEAGLRRESLREMAKHPRLHLREGAVELMRDAHEKDVPLHIFSAGLYDVIHAYIEVHGLDKYSPHVVSNMMEFDNTGVLKGFKGTLIHTLNKNSAALRSSPGWKRVEVRLCGGEMNTRPPCALNMSEACAPRGRHVFSLALTHTHMRPALSTPPPSHIIPVSQKCAAAGRQHWRREHGQGAAGGLYRFEHWFSQ